jgi:hypothetical protein
MVAGRGFVVNARNLWLTDEASGVMLRGMSEQWIIRRHSRVDGTKMYYTGEAGGLGVFTFERSRAKRFGSREDAADTATGERTWEVVRLVRKAAS